MKQNQRNYFTPQILVYYQNGWSFYECLIETSGTEFTGFFLIKMER